MSDSRSGAGAELLVSICNVPFDPRPSCLLRMNTTTYATEPVDVGFTDPLVLSGVGLCEDENYIFHVSLALPDINTPPPVPGYQPELVTQLSVLSKRDFTVMNVQALPEIYDCHSIIRNEDMLYVVSTDTDEVFSYRLRDFEAMDPQLVWTPSGAGQDLHHVNSIAVADGDVVCSAFGPKDGETWATSTHGYIHNVSTDARILEGLHQPHSVTWSPQGFYFCNSRLGTVNLENEVIAQIGRILTRSRLRTRRGHVRGDERRSEAGRELNPYGRLQTPRGSWKAERALCGGAVCPRRVSDGDRPVVRRLRGLRPAAVELKSLGAQRMHWPNAMAR